MRRSISVLAIALVVLLLAAGSTTAQSQYTDQVFRQLQEMYDDAGEDGLYLRNYIVGSLDQGEEDIWTMTFYEDTEYVIYGACDRDCGDIDLTIMGEDGTVVDSDTLSDDYPVVSVLPSKDTRYQVKATMYACSAEPCYFGIGIFND